MNYDERLHWLAGVLRNFAYDIVGCFIIVLLGYLRQKLQARTRAALEVRGTINTEAIMEDKVIVDTKELDIIFKVEDGKLKILAAHEGTLGAVKLELAGKLDAVVDALEKAIPGDWDKIPASMLKEALKKI